MTADSLALEVPATMFDELEAFLGDHGFSCKLLSRETVVRGVLQQDTANYEIAHESASVQLWLERRLGNPTMFIVVAPAEKSPWHRDLASEALAQQILELLDGAGE